MTRIVFFVALVLFCMCAPAFAAPADPAYPGDSSRVLWFLVVSDQHITARNSDGPERLAWLLSDGVEYVEPEIIFNTGDLTDGSNGEPLISVYPGAQPEEWQQYRQILDDSGVTADTYIDLPGNHDQYSDKGLPHYLQYSLAGSTFGRSQHSIVINKPWGNYHFLGIDTSGNDGAIWPLDNAGLDVNELVYIQRSLEDNADANLTMIFGHHPVVRPDLGYKLNEGSDEIQEYMGQFAVRAYFCGHTHEYRELYWPDNNLMPVTLNENVDSFGQAEENNILLVAVDNDNMHVRQVTAGEFPWVIITTPAEVNQGGGNPWAFSVPTGMERAPIRALGFTSDPFLSCQYSLDGGEWVTMDQIADHRYEGFMDTRGMTTGNHTVEVRALPGPATGHKVTFNVVSYACGNGYDDDFDGFADYPYDPGCESVTDSDEYNDQIVPEPVPDVIEADAGYDADLFDTETADIVSDPGLQDVMFPDNGIGVDTPVTNDPGPLSDVVVTNDRGGDGDEGSNSDLVPADSSAQDQGGEVDRNGGGCSTGAGAGGTTFVLLALFALAAMTFRRRSMN